MYAQTRNYGDTVPIAALASGLGALALIRTSGDGSIALIAKIFSRPSALLSAPGNTIVHGWIVKNGAKIDEVLVMVYRAGRSYTGEEGADISCHGGQAATGGITAALRSAGFADALPGEFTFRAFLNGKLDLTRSESVMEMVSARTGTALDHAVKRLSGALETEINRNKEKVAELLSAVELCLDYPEDEIDSQEVQIEVDSIRVIADDLGRLCSAFEHERLYREGALVVIAGKPNSGKSSLFNALLHENRSIVTDSPGTTRDWIEGEFSLAGIPIRLADTAGIRDEAESEAAEQQGIIRSRELLEEADLVLYVIDGEKGVCEEDRQQLEKKMPLIPVWNKTDIAFSGGHIKKYPALVETSARTGQGLEELCRRIQAALDTAKTDAIPAGLGSLRQKELCEEAIGSLHAAIKMIQDGLSFEFIASGLRDALNALGTITGEVSAADILEKMFSRFCLGK
ncbi:MAG: tRNA uridine-5-carboxymethylaminomethyl(34) synthesis GTPase MnmE [Treponema sp.]|jgi:tRNA modification GTPase|nr:tRNA uridine-5-carboxymethylaminomethyl(34) synthesis GTPase MnmE [Treponema sp.]